jgi:hypothetical protein
MLRTGRCSANERHWYNKRHIARDTWISNSLINGGNGGTVPCKALPFYVGVECTTPRSRIDHNHNNKLATRKSEVRPEKSLKTFGIVPLRPSNVYNHTTTTTQSVLSGTTLNPINETTTTQLTSDNQTILPCPSQIRRRPALSHVFPSANALSSHVDD